MTEALHRIQPEGTQQRLRVTLSALEYDVPLADLTLENQRIARLAEYLYLYSEQVFDLTKKDADPSAEALQRSQASAYRMRLQSFLRKSFHLNGEVDYLGHGRSKEEAFAQFSVGMSVGPQEAHTIVAPPFWSEVARGAVDLTMIYEAPMPVSNFKSRVDKLGELLSSAARVDELVIVDNKSWKRAVIPRPARSRLQRKLEEEAAKKEASAAYAAQTRGVDPADTRLLTLEDLAAHLPDSKRPLPRAG